MADVHNDILEDEDFDTILSKDIDFSGKLNFEKSFLVQGTLRGEVQARGVFLVDAGAEVNADITADKVIIRGSVTGDVIAFKRVEVTVSGKLIGNVRAPEIQMESGCVFNGKCTMERIGVPAEHIGSPLENGNVPVESSD